MVTNPDGNPKLLPTIQYDLTWGSQIQSYYQKFWVEIAKKWKRSQFFARASLCEHFFARAFFARASLHEYFFARGPCIVCPSIFLPGNFLLCLNIFCLPEPARARNLNTKRISLWGRNRSRRGGYNSKQLQQREGDVIKRATPAARAA